MTKNAKCQSLDYFYKTTKMTLHTFHAIFCPEILLRKNDARPFTQSKSIYSKCYELISVGLLLKTLKKHCNSEISINHFQITILKAKITLKM